MGPFIIISWVIFTRFLAGYACDNYFCSPPHQHREENVRVNLTLTLSSKQHTFQAQTCLCRVRQYWTLPSDSSIQRLRDACSLATCCAPGWGPLEELINGYWIQQIGVRVWWPQTGASANKLLQRIFTILSVLINMHVITGSGWLNLCNLIVISAIWLSTEW